MGKAERGLSDPSPLHIFTRSPSHPRDHAFDQNLPRSCLKTPLIFYTHEMKSVRQKTSNSKNSCARWRGVLRQTHHVAKLSNNYFTLVFSRFSRAQSWQSCQMLSQNSAGYWPGAKNDKIEQPRIAAQSIRPVHIFPVWNWNFRCLRLKAGPLNSWVQNPNHS